MAAIPSSTHTGVQFGTYPVELRAGTARADADATAELYLSPEPRFVVTCDLGTTGRAGILNAWQLNRDFGFRFKGRQASGILHASRVQLGGPTARVIGPLSGTVEAGDQSPRPFECTFILLNGPDWKRTELVNNRPTSVRWIECEFGGWLLRLEADPAISQVLERLRGEGGYRVTHSATLRRADGRAASVSQLREVLEGLHYFISFAAGRWVGPIAPRGISQQGARVWEVWSMPNQSTWIASLSWCDLDHWDLMVGVLPGFWGLWQQAAWKDPIRRAIHWYVSANSGDGGLEGGIIMCQAALELLGWVVRHHSGATSSGKTVQAANAIRDLLVKMSIPVRMPSSLGTLVYRARKKGGLWKDGPEALTRVRNAVVHAEDRHGVLSMDVKGRFQAWNLGQWYLELVLLNLFGYGGEYANRLSQEVIGDLETVPWA